MIKAFVLTFVCWSVFTLLNGISDAILFYSVFPLYRDMTAWHWIKGFWIGFAVLTGYFANDLIESIWYKYHASQRKKYKLKTVAIFVFFLLWFLLLRWRLHEGLMEIWRTP